MIPVNTLTKRKALFKARFEQALDFQKPNIKKIEQELRRKGVNPEGPVAMASIQRVASMFFNAIDKKDDSPYVFEKDKRADFGPIGDVQQSEASEDKFIAGIEDVANLRSLNGSCTSITLAAMKKRKMVNVVSRIFYQQNKLNEDSETRVKIEEADASRNSPRTTKTVAHEPPRAVDAPFY